MTRISFTKSLSVLLDGADSLLVIAPERHFHKGAFLSGVDRELAKLARKLAAGTTPGDLGATAESLTAGTHPQRLVAGVLPDRVTRHNSPSRAESVRRVMAGSKVVARGKGAVLLLCEDDAHLLGGANAIGRALPLFDARGTLGKKRKASAQKRLHVMAVDPKGRALSVPRSVKTTVESTREAARLVDTPPSVMHPREFQREAWALLRGLAGVKKRQIVGEALERAGLRGVHAVGRTALEAPRALVATYDPGGRSKRHIALVGKGVTYDTGGLNLKGRAGMSGMKADMGGAAATLGAFRVLASTGCKHKVSLVILLAENAIGPAAYKPDDILTMHSGLTVEINNTDAEGRLLLADGVSYAARVLAADTIVDAATLTGAQSIATGKLHAALVTNDEDLEKLFVDAGRASGDLVHPLPFAPEFYRHEFASAVANMRNSVANRANAQASCAAQFIYNHIEDTDVRWAHVDLAGPAFPRNRATGFGVALLAEAVRGL